MRWKLNPPPGWPLPPPGWEPPAGWQPDPTWPAPPPGWQLWLPVPDPEPAKKGWGFWGGLVSVAGVLIGLGAWLFPGFNDPDKESSASQRAPYLQRVDTICQNALTQLGSEISQFDAEDPEVTLGAFDSMRRIYAGVLSEWSALSFPVKGDEPAIRSQLDALERMVRAIDDAIAAFDLSSPPLMREALTQALNDMSDSGDTFREKTRAWGFKVCPTLGS